jgi:hypothetical protein
MNYVDRDKKKTNSENTSCIPNYVIERRCWREQAIFALTNKNGE